MSLRSPRSALFGALTFIISFYDFFAPLSFHLFEIEIHKRRTIKMRVRFRVWVCSKSFFVPIFVFLDIRKLRAPQLEGEINDHWMSRLPPYILKFIMNLVFVLSRGRLTIYALQPKDWVFMCRTIVEIGDTPKCTINCLITCQAVAKETQQLENQFSTNAI